jgi:outer membrane protein
MEVMRWMLKVWKLLSSGAAVGFQPERIPLQAVGILRARISRVAATESFAATRLITVLLLCALFASTASAQSSDWVSQFLNRYRPPAIDPASRVTPNVSDAPWQLMVREGSLPLTVNDVIRLMLQSNLDITVNRFAPLSSEYAIEALFRPFEPTLNLSATVGRTTQPVASQLTAGAGATAFRQLYHRYTIGYGQTLHTGTQVDINFAMNRNSSNNQFNTFNPAYSGSMTYQITQPLLRNYGRNINDTQIRIAQNNRNVSEVDFEIQMIDLVRTAQNLYWDLVYQLEDIKVRKQALDLAEKTLTDNKRQVQIGTMAPIDVVQAESAVAQRQEQMVTTTYVADQMQDRVKRLMTSLPDPALVLAQLNPIDQPQRPSDGDVMPLEEAIKYALESRPELRAFDLRIQNSNMELEYGKNQMRPSLNVGASFIQNGVGGVQTNRSQLGGEEVVSVIRGGLTDAFGQLFGYNYTGYSVGFTLSIPLSNKALQADYSKTLTDKQALMARRNALVQQIALEVRNATSQVVMNRARIMAAEKALELANKQLEAEQRKFQLGTSQLRFVLEEQQNVTGARTNQIQALVNYVKSIVEYDRTVARTLRKNNIEIEKQLQVVENPRPALRATLSPVERH